MAEFTCEVCFRCFGSSRGMNVHRDRAHEPWELFAAATRVSSVGTTTTSIVPYQSSHISEAQEQVLAGIQYADSPLQPFSSNHMESDNADTASRHSGTDFPPPDLEEIADDHHMNDDDDTDVEDIESQLDEQSISSSEFYVEVHQGQSTVTAATLAADGSVNPDKYLGIPYVGSMGLERALHGITNDDYVMARLYKVCDDVGAPKYLCDNFFAILKEEMAKGFHPASVTQRKSFFPRMYKALKINPPEGIPVLLHNGTVATVYRFNFREQLQRHLLSQPFGDTQNK